MTYTSSDYSLPLLLCTHAATITADRDEDELFNVGGDESEVIGE